MKDRRGSRADLGAEPVRSQLSGATNQIGSKCRYPFAPVLGAANAMPRPPAAAAGARAGARGALRGYFAAEGFVEVEPAALQVSPGNETHLHGFATELIGGDGARAAAYLHTSPEFAMKKLLAGGRDANFRAGAGVPQPRAQRAARAGIHDARMVSRRRAAGRAEARLRGGAAAGGRSGGGERLRFRGRECRSVRRSRAADACATRF